LTDSAFLVCGLRNVIAVWLTTLPVFLIGASLSRRVFWGYAAATLVFLGTHLAFQSYYPLFIWPNMWTSGHMGLGYALITLWAWMTGRVRAGAFLLCAMPLVHVGQMPPVLGVVLLWGVWRMWRGEEAIPWRMMLPWAAAGAGLVLAYAAWHAMTVPEMPVESPMMTGADAHDAWARYTVHKDVHRAYPRFGEVGDTLVGFGGLFAFVGFLAFARGKQTAGITMMARWCLAYGLLCFLAYVGGIAAIRFLGESVPFLFVAWMPQRLSNHALVLLVPVVCAVLSLDVEKRGRVGVHVLTAALALQAAKPLLSWVLPERLYAGYVAPPEMLLFFLTGAALIIGPLPSENKWVRASYVLLPILLVQYHQTGTAYVLLGMMVAASLLTYGWFRPVPRVPVAVPAALAVVCVGLMLWPLWQVRESLPRSAWDETVAEALAEDPDAMLVTPPWSINVQELTGHPVLATYETHQFISYVPSMAAGIERLYADLYGQRFEEHWGYHLNAWADRSVEEWRALADRYEFEYVISLEDVPLPLEEVVRGGGEVLYAVGEVAQASSPAG
jgi:uncharacterized protein with PQ loop repeat